MLFLYTKNLLYLVWQDAITAKIFVYSIFKNAYQPVQLFLLHHLPERRSTQWL